MYGYRGEDDDGEEPRFREERRSDGRGRSGGARRRDDRRHVESRKTRRASFDRGDSGKNRQQQHQQRHRRRTSAASAAAASHSRAFLTLLSDRVAAWRVVRSDSRLRVLVGLAFADRLLGRFILPHEDERWCGWVEIVLFITKPRALNLPRDKFHVTATANRSRAYSAVTGIRVVSTDPETPGAPDALFFYDADSADPPEDVPDPAAETFPAYAAVSLDADALAEKCAPPRDPYDCVRVSVGAWWHKSTRCFYYLRMEESLLAICPEGWTSRSLGATLSKLLNHPEGCHACSSVGSHADAYNALWTPGGGLAESCACLAPCLWRKAAQTDVPVRGDRGLCQALFVASVSSVRVLGDRHEGKARITGRLDEVIASGGGGRRVPVNTIGWHLVRLPEMWSAVMIAGCSRLTLSLGSARVPAAHIALDLPAVKKR